MTISRFILTMLLWMLSAQPSVALTRDEIAQIETELGIQLSSQQIEQLDSILNPSEVAQWRLDAHARIEEHRKADLHIRIVDVNEAPVRGAKVEVKLLKSAFKFGGVVHAHDLNDASGNLASGGITSETWERIVTALFNAVGTGNNFKPRQSRLHHYLPRFLAWTAENDLDTRGHLLIWPGSKGIAEMDTPGSVIDDDYGKHLSKGLPESLNAVPGYEEVISYNVEQALLDYKNSERTQADKDALEAVVDSEITQWASLWNVYEWDVINETVNNRLLMDIMGFDQMAEWFKLAKLSMVNPKCKLLINDYQIISAMDDSNAPAWANYINRRNIYMASIDRILADGGPLDRIGFQNRYKFGIPDPEITYRRLVEWGDKYSMEMVGTEFEVVDNPDGFSAFDFSEEERALITEQTLTTYYSHPLVTGLFNWTFMHASDDKAMAYYDGSVKLNGLVWYYLHRIRFTTHKTSTTSSDGSIDLRAFKGEYKVNVTYEGQDYPAAFELSEDKTLVIKLTDVAS